MKLIDRYKKVVRFQIYKAKDVVYLEIVKISKGQKIDEHNIQIIIKPSFSDPFAGRGFVNVQMSNVEGENRTDVTCEIVPRSMTKRGLYTLTCLLSAWTIIALLVSHNFYSFLTVAFGWTIMLVIIHLTQVLNQGKLENYIRDIVSTIKSVKQKSIT